MLRRPSEELTPFFWVGFNLVSVGVVSWRHDEIWCAGQSGRAAKEQHWKYLYLFHVGASRIPLSMETRLLMVSG